MYGYDEHPYILQLQSKTYQFLHQNILSELSNLDYICIERSFT